jgi:phosphoenolpyruvate synthase/pyruvate phosphate dikinase
VYTQPLAELRSADEARFGGKSASLGELIAAGLPVPPGFAVSAAATEAALDEIASAYRALGEPPVAVRSSAIGEDSDETTFAGLQDTYLWVRGPDRVCAAVRDCWASLDNPEAVSYRERMGVLGKPAMGVAVQAMVDAAVSGVMFTCNPVSGDPSTIAVNASWGLGLAVVGGEVTPDEYRLSKVTGEVLRRTVGRKHLEYTPGPRGAVRRDVPEDRIEAPCLDDAQLAALVEMGRRVERHFGAPQDIEWAIDHKGELSLLQSRPVTTRREKSATPASRSALDLVMDTFGARRGGGS